MTTKTTKSQGESAFRGSVQLDQVSPPSFQHEYGRVVNQAQLAALNLVASNFQLKPSYFAAKAGGKDKKPHKPVANRFKCNITQVSFDEEEGLVSALFGWSLEITDSKKKENLLHLSCDYLILYQGLTGCNADAAKAFVQRVGSFATFPYFRAFASQINWASGADLPPLPVLRESNRERATSSGVGRSTKAKVKGVNERPDAQSEER